MTRISVIIPVYNDQKRLASCLKALADQALPQKDVEVLVVDNGSNVLPTDVVEPYANCRLLSESQPGSYAARNRALDEAHGELIAFTDSDCIPDRQWLANGVAFLSEHPEVDAIGGQIMVFPVDTKRPRAVELYDMVFGLKQETNVEIHHHAATANMMTRRSVFDRVGKFETQVLSGGDRLWGANLTQQGGTIAYRPDVIVKHPARQTLKALLTQSRRMVHGRLDRPASDRQQRSMTHRLWVAGRLILPNVARMLHARRELRIRGYGFFDWLRTTPVTVVVQYSNLLAVVRRLLGGRSERS